MKRNIEKELLSWKTQHNRLPLLLRGARQVGKTFIVEKFGKEHFPFFLSINFEQQPEFTRCFDTLDPKQIVAAIEFITNVQIISGKTLLFLDEIQECPKAIMALRYFKEQMPELHVIGAGSLLEFALHDTSFRMPVGRVEFLFLKPLSFAEFLEAGGNLKLKEHLTSVDIKKPIIPMIHDKLLSLVKEYINLGGMPAVLSEFFATRNLLRCQEIQSFLLATYQNDFGKYSTHTQYKNLQLLFERAPGLISQWFKYSKIDPDIQARDLKIALEKICEAGLAYQVFATNASGLPLVATANTKKFKLLFLDVGLVKRTFRLDLQLLFQQDLMLINQGALAEQFVGQEILAYGSPKEKSQLFFWVREQKSSSAEVDYITNVDSQIVPIEVKSGSTGRLKSLKIFMQEKKCPVGVRISQAPLSFEDGVLSIPFYLISELQRLVEAVQK